jgi:hypothetical protein
VYFQSLRNTGKQVCVLPGIGKYVLWTVKRGSVLHCFLNLFVHVPMLRNPFTDKAQQAVDIPRLGLQA